jgi:hypothetical protein
VNSFSSSETRACPICDGEVDARATGRPPRFCSTYCRNKAAGLRRHARQLREHAKRLHALAEVSGFNAPYGNAEHLERMALADESHARQLLAEIGELTMEGDDATPAHTVGGTSGNPCLASREEHFSETPEGP